MSLQSWEDSKQSQNRFLAHLESLKQKYEPVRQQECAPEDEEPELDDEPAR